MPDQKPIARSEFDYFLDRHDKDHERIDNHLSIIHQRMWSLMLLLVAGLFALTAWLIINGGFLTRGGS